MSSGLTLVAWVHMHYRSWLVWGRAPSPVQDERSSAAAYGHDNSAVNLTAIALVSLGLAITAHAQAQNKTTPAPGATRNEDPQLYRNTTFGFRYQIPYGWVDRTHEMGAPDARSDAAARDMRTKDAREQGAAGKAEVLLAVFERPPEATGNTINSAIVIASESTASYPGLKKAEDYLGPLTELAISKGFRAEGEPYALEVESRQLLRADFIKPLSDKLAMRQCTLVLLAKGRIVSFTFIAGSEDELDDLMDGLHFGPAKSSGH